MKFVGELWCDGGGGNGGEAMIDGLDFACSNLIWRAGASKIVIIIGDEEPHGEEFGQVGDYPNGCPCKR